MGYIVSFLTGAIIGYLFTILFRKRGWGFYSNIIAGGIGGIVGEHYIAEYLHSLENYWFQIILSALIGSIVLLSIIGFVYSYDNTEDY